MPHRSDRRRLSLLLVEALSRPSPYTDSDARIASGPERNTAHHPGRIDTRNLPQGIPSTSILANRVESIDTQTLSACTRWALRLFDVPPSYRNLPGVLHCSAGIPGRRVPRVAGKPGPSFSRRRYERTAECTDSGHRTVPAGRRHADCPWDRRRISGSYLSGSETPSGLHRGRGIPGTAVTREGASGRLSRVPAPDRAGCAAADCARGRSGRPRPASRLIRPAGVHWHLPR